MELKNAIDVKINTIIKGNIFLSENIFISCLDKSNEKTFLSFFFLIRLSIESTKKAK